MRENLLTLNKSLMGLLREGDECAFEDLFWQYNARVYNFVNSILYDPCLAEDITQQVFLKIWEKREFIDPEKSFSAFLYTIARNLVYKEAQRQKLETKYIEHGMHSTEEADHSSYQEVEALFLSRFLNQIIERLPFHQKKIFKLSRVDHKSNKEIAQELNLSERAVESHLYRSMQFLRTHMKTHFLALILLQLSQAIK